MHLIVDAEVIDVDDHGHTTEEASTIRAFTGQTKTTAEKPILQPGQKILAKIQGHETTFIIDGKPADKSLAPLLNQFFHLTPSDEVTPDDVFGSTTPRRVGDSWPINPDRMAASFLDTQYEVDPKNISGTVHLASVETYENQPCIKLQADVTVKHVMPTSQYAQKEYAQKPGWNLKDEGRTYRLVWIPRRTNIRCRSIHKSRIRLPYPRSLNLQQHPCSGELARHFLAANHQHAPNFVYPSNWFTRRNDSKKRIETPKQNGCPLPQPRDKWIYP